MASASAQTRISKTHENGGWTQSPEATQGDGEEALGGAEKG